MFNNKKFIIHYENGDVKFIDNLYDFVNKMGHFSFDLNCGYFSTYNKIFTRDEDTNYLGGYYYFRTWCDDFLSTKFFVYNEQMNMIHPNQILYWYLETYIEKREKRLKEIKQKTCRRRTHKSWRFRHPKTLNERRSNSYVCKEDGEPPIRGRRKNLPTSWDDYTAQNSTGWKKSTKRRRQWK